MSPPAPGQPAALVPEQLDIRDPICFPYKPIKILCCQQIRKKCDPIVAELSVCVGLDADFTILNAEEAVQSSKDAILNPVYHLNHFYEIWHDFYTNVGGSKSYAKYRSDAGDNPLLCMTSDNIVGLNYSFLSKGTMAEKSF